MEQAHASIAKTTDMTATLLKLRQAGEAVLRTPAKPLSLDEIHSPKIQRLITATGLSMDTGGSARAGEVFDLLFRVT